ncbi:DMT family transporter [Parachitinimonas caeni]|uniref:DMT family transporter n=1 Tax=Parachitinimonas caeni TaxID=3031301 RepID=A0ABT7E0J2_9NEIS|nr:DMT family transporter [Parachitinimonas caeni]MDK2124422.1 DMT family transporter [Parachitinimonas caeni]
MSRFEKLSRSGVVWILIASFLFSVMGVMVKLGASQFTTAELLFYRCAASLVVMGGVVWYQGYSLRTGQLKKQLSRSISGTVSMMFYFYAISHLPLGTAFTLNYTSPMFLAALSTLYLHERFNSKLLGSIIAGFAGVALLLHPTFEQSQWLAGVSGLLSGLLSAVAYLNVRLLSQAGEPDWRTVFYFSLISTLVGFVWMMTGPLHAIDGRGLLIIVGMGVTATLAQLALTRAYRTGKPLVMASLAYSTVLFSTFFGMVFWHDRHPTTAYLAIMLIIGAGVVAVMNGRR